MTRDERDHLRNLIDTAKRARLQRARVDPTASKRGQYWADYYARNRARIIANRKAKTAAKAAA